MRILVKGAVVLVVSLFTLGAAQEATPQKKDGMTMEQGNMNQDTMGDHQGMMAMMQMMEACSSMMQMMQGKQMGMMGGQMNMKPMNMGTAATKALARAFLTGRDAAAALTLQNVLATEGGYTVGYLQGGTSGKLLVDAATGNVQPQTAE